MTRATIRIGTSEAGGTFHTQGLAIAEIAAAAGVTDTIEVSTSASASVGNARKLDAGDLDFGFMASNWIGRPGTPRRRSRSPSRSAWRARST